MKLKKSDLKMILSGRRKEKDLSQKAVVDLSGAGISRQFYSMIENAERRPSVGVAKALGKVLDVDWTIFLKSMYTKSFLLIKNRR